MPRRHRQGDGADGDMIAVTPALPSPCWRAHLGRRYRLRPLRLLPTVPDGGEEMPWRHQQGAGAEGDMMAVMPALPASCRRACLRRCCRLRPLCSLSTVLDGGEEMPWGKDDQRGNCSRSKDGGEWWRPLDAQDKCAVG